jgi:HAD superfamily hydrolase (TIGR01484 family)
MRYHALACDYDGTLADNGKVAGETLLGLEKLLATGRKLILVTGRELDDLRDIFPEVKLFHRVVAENGAVLYDPATGQEKALAAAVPDAFVRALGERGVEKVSTGRVIVSTKRSQESAIAAAVRDMGLQLHTVFNRGAVMVMPPGVNKATGLLAALDSLNLSAHDVVAVGDAENDQDFLSACKFSVAVANALPQLKEHADWVTRGEDGAGVRELIEELIDNDLEPRNASFP